MFFINSEASHQNVVGNFFLLSGKNCFCSSMQKCFPKWAHRGTLIGKITFPITRMFSEVGTQGNIDTKDNVSACFPKWAHRGTLIGNKIFATMFPYI